jgi:hypothetical protein
MSNIDLYKSLASFMSYDGSNSLSISLFLFDRIPN